MATTTKRKPVRKAATRRPSASGANHELFLRTGERSSFRRCRQQWWWAWRDGLVTEWTPNSLWFGEGIHFALAPYYKLGTTRGPHPAETFKKWAGSERKRIFTRQLGDEVEGKFVDAIDLGMAMLNHYVDVYGDDSEWEFICTEQSMQHPITVPVSLDVGLRGQVRSVEYNFGNYNVTYGVTFDGVFRDTEGRIWLAEHKTASQIQTRHLVLDDQAGSYWAIATDVLRRLQLIKPKESIEGVMYNFLRKAEPDKRERNEDGHYLNKDGSVSKSQPAPYFLREPVFRLPQENQRQLERIKQEVREMVLVRQGLLPVTKNTTRDCPMCPFFQMCQLHESGDDWEDYRDMVYQVADPYEKHRKSAAG